MLLSRLSRPNAEKRSIDEIADLLDSSVFETASGASVTDRSSMRQSTVWACVRILSESIAQLPIEVKRVVGGRIEDVPDHPALDVVYNPNDWQTAHEFIQQHVAWMELRGNGYAFKVRDGRGRVRRLLPINNDAVDVEQNTDWSLSYQVGSNKRGVTDVYTADRIFHLRNFGLENYVGLSTIGQAREAIGLALQTEKHGASLFRHGAQLSKLFRHPSKMSQEAYDRLKESIKQEYSGAENAGKTMILEEGMEVDKISMTAEDAQFLETRKFQKEEIASIFGVPSFLLNSTEKSTTWGSGLEQITRGFLRFTLAPRLSRITQTMKRELLTAGEQRDHFFVFNTDQFSLGEFKERMEGYKTGIESGVISPNEARSREGMNVREGGDEYRMPANVGNEGEDDGRDDDSTP